VVHLVMLAKRQIMEVFHSPAQDFAYPPFAFT
jgi:hypothetical protein